jgi:hypothetical protein
VLRDALEAFAKRNGKLTVSDLAGDLIGSVDGPANRSTDPKYMAGFGR